jgi:hypothetical protein
MAKINLHTFKNYMGLAISGACAVGFIIALLYMQIIIASILALLGLCTLIYTIYSFVLGPKADQSSFPTKKSKYEGNEVLTLAAAKKMVEGRLNMRNSNTKQLISRHYRQGQYPDSHGIGCDYAVPLWTVALPLRDLGKNHAKIEEKIVDFVNQRVADTSYLDNLSEEQAQLHLQDYVQRIKQHMVRHAPLGINSNPDEPYDFEVLLAEKNYFPRVDDFSRYSTGGRTVASFDHNTIAYRATLNQIDITFIKSILKGDWDGLIQSTINRKLNDKGVCVVQTARIALSHIFAVDILTAKIVSWVNHRANPIRKVFKKKIFLHTLSHEDLKSLLTKSLTLNANTLRSNFDEGCIHHFSEPATYNKLLDGNKLNADVMEGYKATG